jgi:biopolymer transport protein ExbB/TolQ
MTAVSMVRSFQLIGEPGPTDSAALNVVVGDALMATMLGIVLMLPGVAMMF